MIAYHAIFPMAAVGLNPDKYTAYFIIAGILILSTICGIIFMSKIHRAKLGNRIGTIGSFCAIFLTLWAYDILTAADLWIAIGIGMVIGLVFAARIKMIQMPQMVALLNGFGGAASAIASAIILWNNAADGTLFVRSTAAWAVAVGSITLSGSVDRKSVV